MKIGISFIQFGGPDLKFVSGDYDMDSWIFFFFWRKTELIVCNIYQEFESRTPK